MIGAFIENCFDGRSLDRYRASLKFRDALIELKDKHGYVIITYRGREHDIRKTLGLTHNDDIDNADEITQEVNAAKNIKTIHIIYGRINSPYYWARQSGEVSDSNYKKYFNFLKGRYPYSATAFEHLENLLEAEKRMLYAQKDEY